MPETVSDQQSHFIDYMDQLVEEGWTQTQIATQLGLHRSTVNAWFTKGSIPPEYRANYIAEAFGFEESKVRQAIRRSKRERGRHNGN